ncbi:hypothetical protein EYC80_009132 [Monilinia laxa]|uniref:Uncharacterized protein n=1 Tax=Monilinia laxa TaxID=61186 RepID=A0A5N6K2N7_MONLA|nr:hypothetical protein EYC80_009132 [Monilinia laxa]
MIITVILDLTTGVIAILASAEEEKLEIHFEHSTREVDIKNRNSTLELLPSLDPKKVVLSHLYPLQLYKSKRLDLRIFPKFKIPQSTTTYPLTISSGSHPPRRLDEHKLYLIKSQNPFDHPNHPTDLFVRQSQLS